MQGGPSELVATAHRWHSKFHARIHIPDMTHPLQSSSVGSRAGTLTIQNNDNDMPLAHNFCTTIEAKSCV
jgi:hypothetical protein